ncbi:MAG: hypothetical protein NTV70_22795 [Acidobacteria bacterium]|nr:hypothetical protein [Acidobacteriota bacterium]
MRFAFATLALTGLAATAAPTIGAVDINPKSFPLAVPSVVTITAVIADTSLIDGGANLQRIDSSGRVIATYGVLRDDGKNGDAVAGDRIFTVQQSFTEGTVGPIQLRVAAAFKGVLTRVFSGILTVNVSGTAAPKITILSPQNLAYLNTATTTITGTVDIANATVKVNEVNAPLSGRNFSVALPLAEGPSIVTVTAQSPGAPVASSSISVNLDTTAPRVTITSPPDQFQTADSAISVAGVVNDIVVGTVNAEQVTVAVNGQNAQVSNRTFGINSIPLAAGVNTITATGRDRAGNTFTTAITVNRIIPPPIRLSLVSGNNQSGRISTALPQPLVVSLLQGTTPLVNKQVIFKITQNNGQFTVGANPPAASVSATTDAQGRAQAVLTLGTRSGAGGNQVEAYAVGYDGSALFTETGVPANAALIVVDSGNAQTGEVNQKLAKPFIAVVTDAGFNRLANVPVTFTVKSGGGGIDGKAAIAVNTDSDGRAAAVLTLGFQEGAGSNQVEANFPGNTSYPAVFTATGKLTADPTKTSISGVVLDNSNNPLPGVTLRTVLTNQLTMNSSIVASAPVTTTDAQGQFKLQPAPVGFVKLMVDGSTTAKPGKYPSLDYDLVTVAGQNTTVGQPIYLLPIKEDNKLCLTPTTGGGTLTIPEAPGFSLTVKPGQVTFPGGSRTGCVSVTVVHSDKVPMVPGFGQQPRFVVTIQPAGALFNPPAPITLPNVDGLKPGAMTEMYSFDHDIGSFVAIGTGQVSDDGLIIRSSTGVGVLKAGWHCGGDPISGGAVAQCPICFFCPGSLSNCQPQGNGTPCGNGGTCQFGRGCVGGGGCPVGYTLNSNGQCCQGSMCSPPECPVGQVLDQTTGQCVNREPCPPGYTLNAGQCCQGGICTPPECPRGQTFDTATGSCVNNPPCQPGEAFNPGTGSCERVLDTCSAQTTGCLCRAGGSAPGTCTANSSTGAIECRGSGDQCPSSCSGRSCTNGNCDGPTLTITSVSVCRSELLGGAPNCNSSTSNSFVAARDTITITADAPGDPALLRNSLWEVTPTGPGGPPSAVSSPQPGVYTFSPVSLNSTDGSREANLPIGYTVKVSPPGAGATPILLPPTIPPIVQDMADVLRQEYVDMRADYPGRSISVPLLTVPSRRKYNTGNYNGRINLIADIGLSGIEDQYISFFNSLISSADIQQISPCTCLELDMLCRTAFRSRCMLSPTTVVVQAGTVKSSSRPAETRDDRRVVVFHSIPGGDDRFLPGGHIVAGANGMAETVANTVSYPVLSEATNPIASGFRNPRRSKDVGGLPYDQHTRGSALDIGVPGGYRLIDTGHNESNIRCLMEVAGDQAVRAQNAFFDNGPNPIPCDDTNSKSLHVQFYNLGTAPSIVSELVETSNLAKEPGANQSQTKRIELLLLFCTPEFDDPTSKEFAACTAGLREAETLLASPEERVLFGRALSMRSREGAEEIFRTVLREDKTNLKALEGLVSVAKSASERLSLLDSLIDMDPKNHNARLTRIGVLARLGKVARLQDEVVDAITGDQAERSETQVAITNAISDLPLSDVETLVGRVLDSPGLGGCALARSVIDQVKRSPGLVRRIRIRCNP